MNYLLMTPRESMREHAERLQEAARTRQEAEIHHRMRIRSRLRKAILETVRLDGSTRELAVEFTGLIQKAERRLSGRPCC
jgi:head-tail adaptor